MKTIYVLLTKTRTAASRLIHAATGDQYTHASIALDRELNQLYSFARLYPSFPFPAGFVHENLQTAVYARNMDSKCALYQITIKKSQYDFIEARINDMMMGEYRYSVLGLLLCKMDFAHERYSHLFCSQFVSKLLEDSGAAVLPKPSSLMRPVDLVKIPGLHCCYKGSLQGCIAWYEADKNIPAIRNTSLALY